MNFTQLVDDGTYKKSDLSEKAQAFISGMELALEEAETFAANLIDADCDEESETLGKIKREIATTTIEAYKEWLQSKINEMIVVISDTEAAQEENNG